MKKSIWRGANGFTSRVLGNNTQFQEPSCLMMKGLGTQCSCKGLKVICQGSQLPSKGTGDGEGRGSFQCPALKCSERVKEGLSTCAGTLASR